MILRSVGILVLLLATAVHLGRGSAVNPDSDESDQVEDDFEIEFKVNRVHVSDDEEAEDDYDDYDYYLDQLSPVERETIEKEPFKRLSQWKKGWRRHPLFVIILGGLRWDFLKAHQKNLTSFAYLRAHGTSIPFIDPVFPTEDYPVWTSLATG